MAARPGTCAFHLDPPAGTSAIEVDSVHPPTASNGPHQSTPDMLSLQWNRLSLYPAGYYVRQIPVDASVRLPPDWKFAAALDVAETTDGRTVFKTVSYETLVDSPLLAGRHFRQIDLDPGGRSPVRLNVAGDRPADLEIKSEKIAAVRKLVREADTLFAAPFRPLRLPARSDRTGGSAGHHRSSENGVKTGCFDNVEASICCPTVRPFLEHEVPPRRRSVTPDYRAPMRTACCGSEPEQYWGYVCALGPAGGISPRYPGPRCGVYEARAGRAGAPERDRPALIMSDRGRALAKLAAGGGLLRRRQLIWLDVDTLLRERTEDRKRSTTSPRQPSTMASGWQTHVSTMSPRR